MLHLCYTYDTLKKSMFMRFLRESVSLYHCITDFFEELIFFSEMKNAKKTMLQCNIGVFLVFLPMFMRF